MNLLTRVLPWLRNDRSSVAERNVVQLRQQDYLDLIPTDALFHVVKNLSENPYSDRWMLFVDKKDARTVIKCGGELGAVSREMFKTIRAEYFGWHFKREFKLLVKEMAPYLEVIELNEQNHRKVNCEELVSLRKLIFDEWSIHIRVLERTLKAVGGNLLELEINGRTMKNRTVQAISQCKSLQSLSIIYGDFATTLEPVWKSVGRTLTKLEGNLPENELVHLQNYCVKLQKLHFHNLQDLVSVNLTGVIELLKALKYLQVFRIEDFYETSSRRLTPDCIGRLMEVCSVDVSVECHFLNTHPAEFHDCVRSIGPRLRVLMLSSIDFGDFPSDLLPELANIEELSLSDADENSRDYVKMIESIFVEPLSSLQILSISLAHDLDLLPIIARSVPNLRELTCASHHLKVDDFAQLFHAAKHLRVIFLYFEVKSREAALSGILHFISTLKICRNLKDVEVQASIFNEDDYYDSEMEVNSCDYDMTFINADSKEIRDACVPLRNRSLSLSVNDVHFLPS